MPLVLADNGLSTILSELRTNWNATAIRIHLFKSNTTPTTSSVLGDFTEADFAGYAAQDLVTWAAPSVAAHVARMTAANRTFTRSTTGAAQNIYGYYVTDNSDTVLLWAERDGAAPIILTNAGDSYTITPALSEQDLST